MSSWSRVMKVCFGCIFFFVTIAYAFISPPFQVPDEYMHFGRTLSVSHGYARAVKKEDKFFYMIDCGAAKFMKEMPRSVEFKRNAKYDWASFRKLDEQTSKMAGVCPWEIERGSLQMHIPYLYAPQVVGVWIAKLFSGHVKHWLYGARLGNLLFGFGFFLLLLIFHPGSKLRLFVYMTIPMLLSLLGSASGDVMVIVLAYSFFSLLLRSLRAKDSMSSKDWRILAAVAILFGVSKSVYFPLVLLLFLIPLQTRRRTDWLAAGVTFGIALLGLLLWNWLVKGDYYSTEIYGMSPVKQTQWVLDHPFLALKAVFGGPLVNLHKITATFLGVFGWNSVIMPAVWYMLYIVVFVSLLLLEPEPAFLGGIIPRISFVLVPIGSVMLLSAAMFITFTPVGSAYTSGLQGRHFMPILPFLMYEIRFRSRFSYLRKYIPVGLPLSVLLLNFWALLAIYRNFN